MFTRCIGVRYPGVISTINRLMNFLVRLTKSILISLLLRRSRVLFFSFRLFCTVLNEIPISNYLFRYRKEFNTVANFLRSFRYLKLTLLYTLKRGFFSWASSESSSLSLKMHENLCLYIVWSLYWIKC